MAMIASVMFRLLTLAAYRKGVAVLLAACVAGFVLGQVAHQQPAKGLTGAVYSPARTVAVITGALGTPIVRPPSVIVPLTAPRAPSYGHGSDKHPRDADPHNHQLPHAMPLGTHGHEHQHDGAPVPALSPTQED